MIDILEDLKDRIDQNTRARVQIRRMKRNKPLPMKQVYGEDREAICRSYVRYHRNLYRYKLFYTKTRIPFLDPKLEDI